MTRRKFLPEYVIAVAAVAGAFWVMDRQNSRFDEARIADELRAEAALCAARVDQNQGLRFNLVTIYDQLDLIVDLVNDNQRIDPDLLAAIRNSLDDGRDTVDERYPPMSVDDCVFSVPGDG